MSSKANCKNMKYPPSSMGNGAHCKKPKIYIQLKLNPTLSLGPPGVCSVYGVYPADLS